MSINRNRGVDKENVVYVYTHTHTHTHMHKHGGILLSHKKTEIMLFAATWMDLEIVINLLIILLIKYVSSLNKNFNFECT